MESTIIWLGPKLVMTRTPLCLPCETTLLLPEHPPGMRPNNKWAALIIRASTKNCFFLVNGVLGLKGSGGRAWASEGQRSGVEYQQEGAQRTCKLHSHHFYSPHRARTHSLAVSPPRKCFTSSYSYSSLYRILIKLFLPDYFLDSFLSWRGPSSGSDYV